MAERTSPVELRLAGRTLRGTAIRYRERARDRAEMFETGAFQPLGVVKLNLQHDSFREIASTEGGSLRIEDGPDALVVEADLREGSAELALVRRHALRGLSVEFRSLTEHRENGVRIVEKAELPAIGLVDSGSYRTSVELRQAFGDAWLTADIRFGKRMQCECQGPTCTDVEFAPGAFQDLIDRRDVLAVGGGGFANVLGSTRRGTLLVDQTKQGLRVGLTNSQTDTARRVVEAGGVADIFVRPLIDIEQSEYTDEGTTRIFTLAITRALLIKPTVNSKGHQAAKIRGAPQHRRRRLWL